MAELIIKDFPEDEDSTGLLICTGEDIDFDTSDADSVVEISAVKEQLKYTPMCPYGYTLNLEQAVEVVDVLLEAIRNAEQKR